MTLFKGPKLIAHAGCFRFFLIYFIFFQLSFLLSLPRVASSTTNLWMRRPVTTSLLGRNTISFISVFATTGTSHFSFTLFDFSCSRFWYLRLANCLFSIFLTLQLLFSGNLLSVWLLRNGGKAERK